MSTRLLPLDDVAKPRTPSELAIWIASKCDEIARVEAAREPALMRRRPFKEFYEEIFPLSRWATHYYSDREDISIIPNLDNRSFDAVVRDYSHQPPKDLFVEITTAQSPDQHLYMEYLVKNRHVMPWAPLKARGTKRNRIIVIEPMAVEHTELLTRHLAWIKAAAEGKAAKADHYGPRHVLLIVFDDYFYPTSEDLVRMRAFVETSVLTLPPSLSFAVIYLMGVSGKTQLRFDMPQAPA